MLPDAVGIIADYNSLIFFGGSVSRRCHTCQLVTGNPANCCDCTGNGADPNCPFDAVFQSNSWRSGDYTPTYSQVTREQDDIVFMFDVVVLRAQGNNTTQAAATDAWAKNVVSVGGVYHRGTLGKGDDQWSDPINTPGSQASVGPAADGRVKPDLTHFFDKVLTTDGSTNKYWENFGGTSAATPIVAGHFGLFFEMWSKGIFGNTLLDPSCDPQVENCVFKNRPHMTTARAFIINTASQYTFTAQSEELLREHQGWGLPDVGRLYLLKDQFELIVDETTVLDLEAPGNEAQSYDVTVPADAYALRATLVYADPPGAVLCGEPEHPAYCRINDLTLKVTSPSGTCYFGNHPLWDGNWSQSSSECDVYLSPDANVVDVVENVFYQSPDAGTWTVEVIAVEINEDGHVIYDNNDPSECIPNPMPGCKDENDVTDDVDFALVVSIDMDCNQNGNSDADDILSTLIPSEDCNDNTIPDECDIASGTSSDCFNNNGIPDECETIFRGACCFGGSCVPQMTQCLCIEQHGFFQGIGSGCFGWSCGGIFGPQGP